MNSPMTDFELEKKSRAAAHEDTSFEKLSPDEWQALSVLAFMFLRMRLSTRSAKIYETLVELSDPGSAARRTALAGLAAAKLDSIGETNTETKREDARTTAEAALAALLEALEGRVLSTRDAPLLLLKAQALWALGREAEARDARDEFLHLTGAKEADLGIQSAQQQPNPRFASDALS